MIDRSTIGGVILAGGKASRMSFRDKALLPLHDKPLLEYVTAKARPQVKQLVLSLNHNTEHYQSFNLAIVGDQDASYGGPLLGILSAMRWFQSTQADKGIRYLACFPCDVPEFPQDVVEQLAQQLHTESASVAYIHHRNQIQPLFSLWHLGLIRQIEEAISAGVAGPKLLFDTLEAVPVICEDKAPGAFYNINSPEDLDAATQLITRI